MRASARPGIHTGVSIFVEATEHALARLSAVMRFAEGHAPRVELAGASRDAAFAIGAIYDARDGRRDPGAAIEAAQARLVLSWGALAPVLEQAESARDPELAEVAGWLREALDRLFVATRALPRFVAPEPPSFALSGAKPLVHASTRASVLPRARSLPLPPRAFEAEAAPAGDDDPEARLAALGALLEPPAFDVSSEAPLDEDAEPPELSAGAVDPVERAAIVDPLRPGAPVDTKLEPLDDAGYTHHWARALFEEIATLGLQRTPLLGDDWRAFEAVDARIAAALDAYAGLGEAALGELEALALDTPAPDPSRVYAVAMIAATVTGRDLAGLVESVVRRLDAADPELVEPVLLAARLAPSDALSPVWRSFVADADPALARLGFAALVAARAAARDARHEELVRAASSSDHATRALALTALAEQGGAEAVESARAAFAPGEPVGVRSAALRALLILRDPGYDELALAELGGAIGAEAALGLAIAGRRHAELCEAVGRAPTPEGLRALGWAGTLDAAPILLAALSSDDEALAGAAATALARIVGPGPIEQREIAPEALGDPSLLTPQAARDASERPSGSARADDEGSPDTIEVHARDSEAWAERVAAARARGEATRWRFGAPWSPLRIVEELEASELEVPISAEDRRLARLELVVHARLGEALDTDGWVVDQLDELARLRRALVR